MAKSSMPAEVDVLVECLLIYRVLCAFARGLVSYLAALVFGTGACCLSGYHMITLIHTLQSLTYANGL